MLVIARYKEESVLLKKDGVVIAKITILSCGTAKVRLGIVADGIDILREEISNGNTRRTMD